MGELTGDCERNGLRERFGTEMLMDCVEERTGGEDVSTNNSEEILL